MNDKGEIKKQILDQLHAMQQRIEELEKELADQKKIEETTQEKMSTLRFVTDNMSDMFSMVDRSGFYQYVSPSHLPVMGYNPDEMVGKLAFDYIHHDDQEGVVTAYARSMATGLSDKLEYRIRQNDGQYIWVESIGNVVCNSEGSVIGAVICTRDNTGRRKIEAAQKDNQEQYRRIIDKTRDVIYSYLSDGTINFVSESISQLGFTPEEIIGRNIVEFVFPDDQESVKEAFEKALEGFHPPIQFRALRKDGGFEWMEEISEPVITDGSLVQINGIIRNINERVQVEEALKASENRYRTIFETTGTAMIIIDDDDSILLVNKEAEKLSGFSKEELEGKKKWQAFVPPEDIEKLLSYREQRKLDTSSAPQQYEMRIINKQGDVRNILNSASMIPGTSSTVSSLLDITDRKQLEMVLSESEQKYRLLIEKSNEAIIIAQDGVIKFANPKVLLLSGYSADELAQKPFVEMIHPDDRQMVIERYEKRLKGDIPAENYSFRVLNQFGEDLLVDINPMPVMWEEKPAILCFIRDITEDKMMEAKVVHAQKMEALGAFAGGIAHEFNEVLMGIQGHTSMMLLGTDPLHPHFEKLKEIEHQVLSGASLTRRLLGLASADKYEIKTTSINELLEKTSFIFSRTTKEITIIKEFYSDLWAAEVDRSQIEQMLFSLYINAWQAMPKGGELHLATNNVNLDDDYLKYYGLKGGRYIQISIRDTGIGMDERTRLRIFDPFFTTQDKGKGTGLGLTSAYSIIKNHSGFIDVQSEKAKGSTFQLYLPASEKEAEKPVLQTDDPTKKTETILVVDDERTNIIVTTQMLEALGYRTMAAKSGQEAINLFHEKHNEIDLVILDMVMPGMSGEEAFDIMKDIKYDVKVILTSGYSLDSQAASIIEKGCKAFIQKPVTLGILSQQVRSVLDKSSS